MAILRALDRTLNAVYSFCGYIAGFLLVTLLVLVLLSIGTRLASVYIGGLTEYAGYAMAAANFFALAYTFRGGGHIRVAMLLSHLSIGARHKTELWCLAVTTSVACYLAFYMVRLTLDSHEFEERSEGGDAILLWMPQSVVAAGAILFAICLIHTFIVTLASGETKTARERSAAGAASHV